jgi:cellulose synthase (UDP-forming)
VAVIAWVQQECPLKTSLMHFANLLTSLPLVPDYYLWMPTIILLIGTWLITRVLSPQPRTWSRRLFVGVMFLLIVRYLIWRIFATLNLSTPLTSVFSLSLLAAELLGLASSVIQLILLFKMRDRSTTTNLTGAIEVGNRPSQADRYAVDVLAGHYLPSVDVLIPSYNEPEFILRRTIIGTQAMNYANFQVYLLDDTRRPEIKALATELGCRYISRFDNRYAKAGNLNHAIEQTTSELIVCFDADFIPTHNFLQRTVGFFQNPQIALLQTPQSFYNPDPIARNLGLENIITPDEEVFYRQIQPMRDAVGSVVCAGTSFVLRRQAIEEIGGFVTDSLSEDYFTAIRLAAKGHQVVYLNEKLSAGLAAENIAAHASQRLRWARGTLQAFFISSNPLTIAGLSWIQRLGHLEGILHWFTSFSRAYFLLMPLVYAFFAVIPIRATGAELVYFFLPFYFTQLATFAWLNGNSRSAFLSDIYSLVLVFPIMATVCDAMFRPFAQGFKVTPKGMTSNTFVFNWHLAWPLLILFVLNVYSLGHILFITPNPTVLINAKLQPSSSFSLSWIWSIYNLVMTAVALMILIDVPRTDPYEYFALQQRVKISFGNQAYYCATTMLAEIGCYLTIPKSLTLIDTSQPVSLEILEIDLKITGIAIELDPATIHILFDPLSLSQQRQLIPLLFCRPGQWRHARSPGEFRSIWLLLKVLLRPQIFIRKRRRKAIKVIQHESFAAISPKI